MSLLYIGPGLGAGALLTIIGIVVLVVITLITFFWFPIKRFFKNRKK